MPPLGLLYLASAVKAKGYSVMLIDCTARRNPLVDIDEITKFILAQKPHIVGISATTYQIFGAVQLAQKLKATQEKDLKIVLGGSHVTADTLFRTSFNNYFDVYFIGEGEITFPSLVSKLMNEERVNNVCYGSPPDLNTVPLPARELIDPLDYFEQGREFANIQTSRGCPYQCIFCGVPKIMGHNLRVRRPASVVDEMEKIGQSYDWHYFLIDDCATANRDHMLSICYEILRRGLDLIWGCQTRPDLVDKDLLLLMYKAGCRYISFGIESGSPRVRTMIGKPFSNEQIKKAVNFCKEIGIATLCSFMIGFPTETENDLIKTYMLAKTLGADAVNIARTEVLPGTSLFENAVAERLVDAYVFQKVAEGEVDLPIYYIPPTLGSKILESFQESFKGRPIMF
jgi:radical SAM superfamily enzyme YgiQ (UPF0313 family)